MFIAYTSCLVIKTPDNSSGASKYWEEKAHKTKVDTTLNIVGFSILDVFIGIPVAMLLLAGLCYGFYYPFFLLSEKFKEKQQNSERPLECIEKTVD